MCCHHLQGRCWPWRWKKSVSPKRWCLPTRLHSLNYVNWFVFPPSCAWDWLSLLRYLFCCYFVSSGKCRNNAFKWSMPISTFFALHQSWSFFSWYHTNCVVMKVTHTLLCFPYWDFTCGASHLSMKTGFWSYCISKGNGGGQIKNTLQLLYVSTASSFDRLHLKFLRIWMTSVGANDICIHNGSSPLGDRIGNGCVSLLHLEIGNFKLLGIT